MRDEIRERRLELPAGDGRVARCSDTVHRVQLQHVAPVGGQHPQRLLAQDSVAEIGNETVDLGARQVVVVALYGGICGEF